MSNTVTPQNFFDEPSNISNIIESYIDDNPVTGGESEEDFRKRLTGVLNIGMKDLRNKEYKSIDEIKKAIYSKLSAYVNKTSVSYKEEEQITADSRVIEAETDTDPTKSGQIGSFLFGIRDATMQLSKFEQGLISFEIERKRDPEYQDKDFDEKRNLYKQTHGAITNSDKTTFNVYGLGDGYNNPSLGKTMDSTYFENWVKRASESVIKTIYPKLKNSVIHRPGDFSNKSTSQSYKNINITSVDDFDGVQLSHNISERIPNIFHNAEVMCEEFGNLRAIFTLFYNNYEKAVANKFMENKDDTEEEQKQKENAFNEAKKRSVEQNHAILKDCYIFCVITLCVLKKQYMSENNYEVAEKIDAFISENWMYDEVMSTFELYKKASEYENMYGSDRISDYLKKFVKHEFFPERRDLASISLVFDNDQAYNDEFTIKELVKLFYENMGRKHLVIQERLDNIQEKVRKHFYDNQFPIRMKINVKHLLSQEISLFIGKKKEDVYELNMTMDFRNITYGSSNPSLVVNFDTTNMQESQKVLFVDLTINIDGNVFPHDKLIRDALIADYRYNGKTFAMNEMKMIYDEVLADRYRWKENKDIVYDKLFDTIFDHKEMMSKIKFPEKLEKLIHNLLLNIMVLIKERKYEDNNIRHLIINEFFSLIYPYFSGNEFIKSLKRLVLLESQLLENNSFEDVLVNFEQIMKNYHDDKDIDVMEKKNQIDAKRRRERDNQEKLKIAKEDLSTVQKKYANVDSKILTMSNEISKLEADLKTLRDKKKADVERKNKQKKANNDPNQQQEKGTQQGESKTKADTSMDVIKAKEDKIKTMKKSLDELISELKELKDIRQEKTDNVTSIEEFIKYGDADEIPFDDFTVQKEEFVKPDNKQKKKPKKAERLSAEEQLMRAEELLKIQEEKQAEIAKQIELGRQRKLMRTDPVEESVNTVTEETDLSNYVPEQKTVIIREVNNSFEIKIRTELIMIPDGYSKSSIDEHRKIKVHRRSIDDRRVFEKNPVPRAIRTNILSENEELIPLTKEFMSIMSKIGAVIRENMQELKKSLNEYFAPMETVFKIETPFRKRQDASRLTEETPIIRIRISDVPTVRTKFSGLFGKNFIDLKTIKPLEDGDSKLFGTKKGTGAMYPHQASFCESIHRAISQNEQNSFIDMRSNLGSGKTTSVIAAAKIISSYNRSIDINRPPSTISNVYKDNGKAIMIFSTTSKKSLFELFVKFNSGTGVSNTEVIGIFDKKNSGFAGRAGDGLSYFYFDPMAGRKKTTFINKPEDIREMAYMKAQIICGHPRNIIKYIAEKEKHQISRKVILIIDEVATSDDHKDNEDENAVETNRNVMNTNNEHAIAILLHLPGINSIAVLSASLDDSPAVNFIMDQQSTYKRFAGDRDISNIPSLIGKKGRETIEIRNNMDRKRNTQTISSKFVIVPSSLLQINNRPMDNFDGYNDDAVISQVVSNETFRRFLSYRNVDEFARIGGYGNADNDILVEYYNIAVKNAGNKYDNDEYIDLVDYSSAYWKNAIKNNVYDSAIFCTNIARKYQKLFRKYFPVSHEDYLNDTKDSIAKYEQYRKEKYQAAMQIEKLFIEYETEVNIFTTKLFSSTDDQIFNMFFRRSESVFSENVFIDKENIAKLYNRVFEPVVLPNESVETAIKRENQEYLVYLTRELELIKEEKSKLRRMKDEHVFIEKQNVQDDEILRFDKFDEYRSLLSDGQTRRIKKETDDSINQLRIERLGLMKIERHIRSKTIGKLPEIPDHDYNLEDIGNIDDETEKIEEIRNRLNRITISDKIFNKVLLIDEIKQQANALSNFYLYGNKLKYMNGNHDMSLNIATISEIKHRENLTVIRNMIKKYWSFESYLNHDLSEMQRITSNSARKNNKNAGQNLARAKILIAEIKESLRKMKNAAYDLFSDHQFKSSRQKSQLINDEEKAFDAEKEKYLVKRKQLVDLKIDEIDIDRYIRETMKQIRQITDEDERILKCPEYVLVASRDPVGKFGHVYGELIRKVNYAAWKFINDHGGSLDSDSGKDIFRIKGDQSEKNFVKKAKKNTTQGAEELYNFYKKEMEDVNEYYEYKNNRHYTNEFDANTLKFMKIRNEFFKNTRYSGISMFLSRLSELSKTDDISRDDRNYLIAKYKEKPSSSKEKSFFEEHNTKFEYIDRHATLIRRYLEQNNKKEFSQSGGIIDIFNEQVQMILDAYGAVLPHGIVSVNGVEFNKLFKQNNGSIEDVDFQDFAQYVLKMYVSTKDHELPPENQKINRCFGNSTIAHRINRPFEAVLITKSFEDEPNEVIIQICGRSGRPGKSDISVIYMSHRCYQEILDTKEITPLDNLAYRVKHYLQTEEDDIYGPIPGEEKNNLRRITTLYNRIAPIPDDKLALLEEATTELRKNSNKLALPEQQKKGKKITMSN